MNTSTQAQNSPIIDLNASRVCSDLLSQNPEKKCIHVKEVGLEIRRAPETAVAIQDRWSAHGITYCNGEIVAEGFDLLEEEFEIVVPDVLVEDDVSLGIEDADVHGTSMKIDSAVEGSGGLMVSHLSVSH